MPGLVNCHGHTPMALLRSAGDGLPLDRWLHESIWPREARLDDEDVYWGMLFGATEMLCNGMTTTCEQYRHPSAVVEAVVEAGIRTVYTPAIFDVPNAGPDNTWEALLEAACRARRRRRRKTRATPDGIRAACRLHGATGGRESHRRRGPSARRIAADPSFGDGGRMRGRVGSLRHERAGTAGIGRGPGGSGVGSPCRLARRRRPLAARRARCGRRALPGLQWKAGLGDRPSASAPGRVGSGSAWGPTAPPPTTIFISGTKCGWPHSSPVPSPAIRMR